MCKTALRRHHTYRLINKYKRLQKHRFSISDEVLSFGRVFSKDPLDCGNSKCEMCGSYNWLFDSSKPKQNTIDFSDYEDDYLLCEDNVHLYP